MKSVWGKIPQIDLIENDELKEYVRMEAKKLALKYKDLFGRDSFYLELQHHPNIKEQGKVNEVLISFSKKLDIPLVATNDSHYLKPDDSFSDYLRVKSVAYRTLSGTGLLRVYGSW